MNRTAIFLLLILLACTAIVVRAAPSPDAYSLSWWTVDGGGGTFSTGGAYSLGGTIGQSEPGVLTGGVYSVGEGFWRGGAPASAAYRIYLPIIFNTVNP